MAQLSDAKVPQKKLNYIAKANYIVIFIQYRARGDCHIRHSDNVPAGGADPGLLYDGAPRAESQEEGDGDAEEDSERWGRPVQLLLN